MKRLIAILAMMGLMLMPLAISEEIEISNGTNVEDSSEEIELKDKGGRFFRLALIRIQETGRKDRLSIFGDFGYADGTFYKGEWMNDMLVA